MSTMSFRGSTWRLFLVGFNAPAYACSSITAPTNPLRLKPSSLHIHHAPVHVYSHSFPSHPAAGEMCKYRDSADDPRIPIMHVCPHAHVFATKVTCSWCSRERWVQPTKSPTIERENQCSGAGVSRSWFAESPSGNAKPQRPLHACPSPPQPAQSSRKRLRSSIREIGCSSVW
ncbi:uncharacterized protein EI97DRAFT_164269 [Westerdykella ornata]|uniref:Secreted protein n=1 Tax=Westerdykella ornata TaxID=318751 RepID=A0A6A6J9F7_WESOR|nr:uncharacterized protein EI97DRAFT_164269 [Westerdykella ornata]KAF2273201.1 hypothetical protein EI97DRAFT_164269 [Westerdykella ornata]